MESFTIRFQIDDRDYTVAINLDIPDDPKIRRLTFEGIRDTMDKVLRRELFDQHLPSTLNVKSPSTPNVESPCTCPSENFHPNGRGCTCGGV